MTVALQSLAPPSERHPGTEGRSVGAWELLATAVAGRSISVAASGDGTSFAIGGSLHLAADADARTVVVQSALVAAGSLDASVMARLVGRPGTRGRYLTLEAARACEALLPVAPAWVVAEVLAVAGDHRASDPRDALARAASTRVPQAPAWFGTLRPARALRAGGSSGRGVEAQDEAGLLERDALSQLDDDAADDAERVKVLDMLQAPLSNPLARKLAKVLGMGGGPGEGDGGGAAEMSLGQSRVGRPGEGRSSLALPPRPPAAVGSPTAENGRAYPEWSRDRNGYRAAWCSVSSRLPWVGESELLSTFVDPALRAQLVRLGLRDEAHRRQRDGDGLDATALTDYAIDLAIGEVDDGRVYEARRRTGRDLGVVVVLDGSGSTHEEARGRAIFDAQREVAARLTGALDELGIRVATYAFYSQGRHDVRFLRVKSFDARYDRSARLRLAAIAPQGFTRLGAAIRHGASVLGDGAGTEKKLLVVIGDGLPYDDGYEGRYAEDDTSVALTEAVERGIGCVCLSVASGVEDDVVARTWGHVAHRRLEAPTEIAAHVGPLFRDALRRAGASGRTRSSLRVA